MKYLKVIDRPSLVRDTRSNAILNNDLQALNKYREERDEKLRLTQVEERTKRMETDIDEIKNLLKELIRKNH